MDESNDELSFKGIAPDDRSHPTASATPPLAPLAESGWTPSVAHAEMPPAPLPAPRPAHQTESMDVNDGPMPQPMDHGQPAGDEPVAPLPSGPVGPGEGPSPLAFEPAPPAPADPGPPSASGPPADAAPARPKVTVEYTDGGPAAAARVVNPRHLVQGWLADMVKAQASDLILRSGGRPSQRLHGRISFLPGEVPGPGPMLEVLRGILGERRMEAFDETGAADAALDLDGLGRFRINAYKQMGEPAIVIRRINEDAPSLDELHLPAQELKELALRKRGLVLVTGVAGSGKSTTLSAMIEFMNRNVERHVVTLEDPVELLFKERYCVISQREVGTDTTSFKQGLKHALRQSPDVILIGEMRDAETVVAALEAIETGHLVMSTMHTVNASQTVDRILGFFPAERHVQIRQRMADTLAGVLSMRLVPRIGGGLVPAYELMQVTPQVRELLEEGKTTELGRVIQSGMERGLVAFNDRLLDLIQEGLVSLEDALQASDRPDELLMRVRGIQGGTRGAARANQSAEPEAPDHPLRRKSDLASGTEGGGPSASKPDAGGGSGLRLRGSGPGY